MTLFTIFALITPQVIAIVQFDSDYKLKNNNINQYEKEVFADEDIWFLKPVHEKIYIADKAEITFPVYSPIIFGPITIQVGCVFQNLSANQQKALNMPTSSIGYLIDKVLKLKGTQKGDALISDKHAAFIENLGQAKANDVYYLYQLIKNKAKDQLDLDLIPEIECIGEF